MTERAPPARTPLTACPFCHCEDHAETRCSRCGCYPYPADLNEAPAEDAPTAPTALTKAFAEGRLAGLREAAELVENLDYPLDCGPGFVLDAAADAVRRLAEDALKAPKTPELPAGKQG